MSEKLELPRDEEGRLILSSPEMKSQAMILYQKIGYTVMDARKAIFFADGDIEKAESILVKTEGFRSSKLITYR
jgi:hypothetical protein